ncbi:MAG: methyltransferase, TIGR04325 family [Desulfobacterales bacterium]|nr:methyltransferase, TIGR04325 family [Desulfobacterales bacterium]
MDVGALVPPIVWQLRPKRSMKLYESYDYALADSHTYEDPGVVHVVAMKTEAFRNALLSGHHTTVNNRQTVQNMFVLSYVWRDIPLDVLEIGGACGASYFELNYFLPGRINRWHVVETSTMSAAARRLFQDDRLIFYDDLEAAASQLKNLDLLIAQGVLQYVKDPLGTLETLLRLGFAFVYITRTQVGEGIEAPIITKQVVNLSGHGPGPVSWEFVDRETSQPLTIVPFESITSRVSVGHNTVYSFDEAENTCMKIGSRSVRTKTIGFLLEKVRQ